MVINIQKWLYFFNQQPDTILETLFPGRQHYLKHFLSFLKSGYLHNKNWSKNTNTVDKIIVLAIKLFFKLQNSLTYVVET